jgi:N-acetylglucosamine-6-phosphate deacetylase
MSALVIENGRVVLPDSVRDGWSVACQEGRIVAVGQRVRRPPGATVVDARGGFVVPGFVDIHVHGGGGADFMDGTVDAVGTAIKAHAHHGTTTLFPTTTTGSPARIRRMLDACRAARDAWEPRCGARIGGVHVYGPYFAEEKVGCHAVSGRRDPDPREYRSWFSDDLVRIATCAAELPGAVAFCRLASRRGCLVTCGHSNAHWSEMSAVFAAGMRHVDHFWCAMSSVASLRPRCGTPMQAGMEQFVLAEPEMSTEVIADGYHLSPELLDFAFRMKGSRRLCLVTDASRAVDMPPGRYRFGAVEDGPEYVSDCDVARIDGRLAGSVVGMDHMVRRMIRDTSAELPDVIRMASLTPAERVGLAADVGSLERGKWADIVLLSPRLAVRRGFIAGVEVDRGR